jgi:preprotein translocase subunit YajC
MIELIAQSNGDQQGSLVGLLLPLVLMGGVFYFLLIRPQQRRSRAQRDLIAGLEVGDEVLTAGGMFGTVVDMDEDQDVVTVEVAPGTKIRLVKRAISQKLVEETGDLDEGYDDEPDTAGPHTDT